MKKPGIVRKVMVGAAYVAASMIVLACASQPDISAEEEMANQKANVAEAGGTESSAGDAKPADEESTGEKVAAAGTDSDAGTPAADSVLAPANPDPGMPERKTEEGDDTAALTTALSNTESTEDFRYPQDPPTEGPVAEASQPGLIKTESALESAPAVTLAGDDSVAAPKKKSRKVARRTAIAPVLHAPVISNSSFAKDGMIFNRFYFLRAGDTPENVAVKLYGNGAKAGDLLTWNGGPGKWAPGEAIFYPSPIRPADNQMSSFYLEASIPPQKYTVQDGETVQTIAKAIYGDQRSWTEIANANGMRVVEGIQTGAELTLWPAKLDGYSTTVEAAAKTVPGTIVANNTVTDSNTAAQQVVTGGTPADRTNAAVTDSATAPAAGTVPVSNTAPPLMPDGATMEKENLEPSSALADPDDLGPAKPKVEEKKSLASMDVGKFFLQNLFVIVVGVVAALVLFFMVRRARNSRDPVDF